MSKFIIQGGKKLEGEVKISGSKNAALPIIAATILNKGKTTLYNVPKIQDVSTMFEILKEIGGKVTKKNNKVITDNAINELQVVGKKYRRIEFELNDLIDFKEKIVSSGIVFATPLGSTAYNKSLGGPILCEGIDAICATLFAPIQNNKTKDYITNSLVGNKFGIKFLSSLDDVEIFIDGQQVDVDFKGLKEINVEIDTKKLYKLNLYEKTYSRNMFEKMIK